MNIYRNSYCTYSDSRKYTDRTDTTRCRAARVNEDLYSQPSGHMRIMRSDHAYSTCSQLAGQRLNDSFENVEPTERKQLQARALG